MDYFERQEAIEHLSQIEGYDPSYDLTYYNSWSGYESDAWMAIFVKNDQFYMLEGGYSPEVGDDKDYWLLESITAEDAITQMTEFEEFIKNNPIGA